MSALFEALLERNSYISFNSINDKTVNGLIGKKIGMTSIYDNNGKNVAVTIMRSRS